MRQIFKPAAVLWWLLVCIPATGTTEQDAAMAASAASWHILAEHFQKAEHHVGALRAAITCIRLSSSDNSEVVSKCHTLMGTLLALHFQRDPQALLHFRTAASLQPSVTTYSNVGLAYARLYMNDESGDWYQSALELQGARGGAWGGERAAWVDTLHRFAEARQVVCKEWDTVEQRMQLLRTVSQQVIDTGEGTPISPFLAMGLPLSPEHVLSITKAHALRAITAANSALESERGAKGEVGGVEGGAGRGEGGGWKFPFPWGPLRVPLDLQIQEGVRRVRVVYLGAHFSPNKLMNGFLRDVWHRHPREKMEVFPFSFSFCATFGTGTLAAK